MIIVSDQTSGTIEMSDHKQHKFQISKLYIVCYNIVNLEIEDMHVSLYLLFFRYYRLIVINGRMAMYIVFKISNEQME